MKHLSVLFARIHHPRRVLEAIVLAKALTVVALCAPGAVLASTDGEPPYAAKYDRLLPLEGGSNFRDMGGYFTADGRQVRRGVLFRSGVMSSLTQADYDYLDEFGFQRVIDLRSSDERELYPNHWASEAGIALRTHDYGMREMLKTMVDAQGVPSGMDALYRDMVHALKPQMKMLFEEALSGNVPLVVNCSAGQDRTGVASALLLLSLGVPRDVVMQDYLQSTRYRRPGVEKGDVDLAAAAETNVFAALMLRYGEDGAAAKPLLTEDGIPYLHFALAQLEADYGSIDAFLAKEVGLGAEDRESLRERYLQTTYLP